VFADTDGMKNVHGYCDRDGNFIVNYFWTQPALNFGFANPKPEYPWQKSYDHPACEANRQEMQKIIRYWLDRGADGFRVDMASTFVKRDGTCDMKNTRRLFGEVREMLDRDYPDAVLISEWGNPAQAIPSGFHVDYLLHYGPLAYVPLFRMNQSAQNNDQLTAGKKNKHAADTNGSFFSKAGDGDIMLFLNQYLDWIDALGGSGLISIPSSNHDMTRLCNGRDAQDLKVCFAFILTMPGTPTLYYGDEIGLPFQHGLRSKEGGYYRTGSRTPMQWDRSANLGFSTGPSDGLYLPVQEADAAVTVAQQEADDDSLLNTVRDLIRLRTKHPALGSYGAFKPLYAQRRRYPFVYQRSLDGETIIIAVNPAAQAYTCEIGLALASDAIISLNVSGAEMHPANGGRTIQMDGISYGIWQVRGGK
jgi:maltose alpha-D-glucosyltransferase/alpha-amylase